jgi:hypothetical protein
MLVTLTCVSGFCKTISTHSCSCRGASAPCGEVSLTSKTGNHKLEMELLLNLAWLLLALPGYWVWRRDAGTRPARRVTSLQCLLALGCALVLLFPVISASDDLHTMRAAMEDSSVSKRTVRQAASDKSSALFNRLQGPPATVAGAVRLFAPEARLMEVSVTRVTPLARSCVFHAGRAPPCSFIG